MKKMPAAITALLMLFFTTVAAQPVTSLKITILSTMLADEGHGEWGFSALVEADSSRILFDAGAYPETVAENLQELGLSLDGVTHIVLSHSHDDHTGGWRSLRKKFIASVATADVGDGFFMPRVKAKLLAGNLLTDSTDAYNLHADSLWYTNTGGRFNVLKTFTKIYPGIYLTGPVPRKHPEKNYSKGWLLKTDTGYAEDNVPEDMSLVIETVKGWVLLSGCGHSGIINTIDYIKEKTGAKKILAAVGGFHLFSADDKTIEWTASELKKDGLSYFIGAHCTGINAVYDIRRLAGLSRSTAVVGAVGAVFDINKGILPGRIAK